MKHILPLIFLFCYLSISIVHAEWQAPVQNFSADDYSAGTQNWQLLEQHNSWIYAANNYGLLEFDGERWHLYGMSTQMRSICLAPDGRIFAGGTGEFGVYKADELGRMHYTSLSDSLAERDRSFGEVWNICIWRERLYLQTRNKIFVMAEDGSYETITADAVFQQMCLAGDALYVACSNGVYLLAGSQLNLLRGSELLTGYEVRSMQQLPDSRLLIATDLGGLFAYDGNAIRVYRSGVDDFIKKNQLYNIAIGENAIAYGTVLNGVIVTDYSGKMLSHYNVQNGLLNNTVLSLMFARDGSLWIGMDQGLARLSLSSALQYLRDDVMSYGSGYCSAVSGGRMYFGTNQGLYCAKITDTATMQVGDLTLVAGSQGQVWNLQELHGVLLCCHNRGLFAVKSERMVPITTAEGYWDIRLRDSNTAYAGTYSGISLLRFSNGMWRVERKIKGYSETSLHIETDGTGVLWTISEQGVRKLIPDAEAENFVSAELIFPYNERHDWYSLSTVDGQVFISSDDTCCLVDRNGYVMSALPLTSLMEGNKFYEMVRQDNQRNIWYIEGGNKKVRIYDASLHAFEQTSRRIVGKKYDYADGFPNICFTDDGKVVSGSRAGFYQIDIRKLRQSEQSNGELLVRRVRDLGSGSVLYGESYPKIEKNLKLPFDKYHLRFEMGGVNDNGVKHNYFTRLLPIEKDFTPCGDAAQRDFSVMSYGKYTLEVKMISEQTGQTSQTSLCFEVLPPWYKTLWAKILYVFIAILFAALLTYLVILVAEDYKRKIIEHNEDELHRQQQQYERDAKEQELKILQLEHEKAVYQLKNKSEKLNGLMLNQVSRNELIENVCTELRKVQDDLSNREVSSAKQRLQQLLHKLHKQESVDIDWESLEDNFDEANNGLMEKLGRMYPDLTKNERRLCIYIHMGLYTKEIAPLMGVTTRGVEMMRYRMRQKLNIDPQENLKDFFASLVNEM